MQRSHEKMIENTVCRPATEQDIPGLKHLWHVVFGDSFAYIDDFFTHVFPFCAGFTGDLNGRAVSCAYMLPLGQMCLSDGSSVPCSVIYAVATLPEFRGHGLGEKVARLASGASPGVSTVYPASDSLFGYYGNKLGYVDTFYRSVLEFSARELETETFSGTISPVSAEEYGKLREMLLTDRTHVTFRPEFLKYQKLISEKAGGGLYKITISGKEYGACAEKAPDGTVFIKELLVPFAYISAAVKAVHGTVRGTRYIASLPADKSGKLPFSRTAMAIPSAVFAPDDKGFHLPWFGFAFD